MFLKCDIPIAFERSYLILTSQSELCSACLSTASTKCYGVTYASFAYAIFSLKTVTFKMNHTIR